MYTAQADRNTKGGKLTTWHSVSPGIDCDKKRSKPISKET